MLIPIALGLGWPDRVPGAAAPVDWTSPEVWEFTPLDDEAFPAVRLAREAGAAGGVMPAVYNAANEVCVARFLDGRLRFTDIVPTIERVLRDPGVPSDEELTVTTCCTPTPGRVSEPRPCWPPTGPGDAGDTVMTVLLFVLGVVVFAVGRGRVDRPARGRPHGPGQEVRREGDAVLRRLRPHGLVHPPRRDRVRPQGDPARRLRQARRDAAAGQGRPARPAAAEQHRHVHPADLRRPPRGVRARQARRRGPALLPPAVVEEGHRDGRGADGQPGHRLPPLRRDLRALRRPRADHHGQRGLRVRRHRRRGGTRVHRGGRGLARPPRPACCPATGSSASTVRRSTAGSSWSG